MLIGVEMRHHHAAIAAALPTTLSHYPFAGAGTAAIVVDSLNSLATVAIIGAILGRWRRDRAPAPEVAVAG